MTALRPSGATLFVVKKFASREDFIAQANLMEAARGVAVPTTRDEPSLELRMPMGTPLTAQHAMDFVSVYRRLWSRSSPRRDAHHDLSAYHEYVMACQDPGVVAFSRVRAACDSLRPALGVWPSGGFVHGDATVSNAVVIGSQVHLIDFSPRPTPSYWQLDAAKLVFSAVGFDADPTLGRAMFNAMGFNWELRERAIRNASPLMQYFFATHILRVLAKEPPITQEREVFFRRVCEMLP